MVSLCCLIASLLHTALVILHIIYTIHHEMIVLLQISAYLNIPKNYYSVYLQDVHMLEICLMEDNRLQQIDDLMLN